MVKIKNSSLQNMPPKRVRHIGPLVSPAVGASRATFTHERLRRRCYVYRSGREGRSFTIAYVRYQARQPPPLPPPAPPLLATYRATARFARYRVAKDSRGERKWRDGTKELTIHLTHSADSFPSDEQWMAEIDEGELVEESGILYDPAELSGATRGAVVASSPSADVSTRAVHSGSTTAHTEARRLHGADMQLSLVGTGLNLRDGNCCLNWLVDHFSAPSRLKCVTEETICHVLFDSFTDAPVFELQDTAPGDHCVLIEELAQIVHELPLLSRRKAVEARVRAMVLTVQLVKLRGLTVFDAEIVATKYTTPLYMLDIDHHVLHAYRPPPTSNPSFGTLCAVVHGHHVYPIVADSVVDGVKAIITKMFLLDPNGEKGGTSIYDPVRAVRVDRTI